MFKLYICQGSFAGKKWDCLLGYLVIIIIRRMSFHLWLKNMVLSMNLSPTSGLHGCTSRKKSKGLFGPIKSCSLMLSSPFLWKRYCHLIFRKTTCCLSAFSYVYMHIFDIFNICQYLQVIFVDADQIVRADMGELYDMDIKGRPLAYTPFCDNNKDMDGYRFWRQVVTNNALIFFLFFSFYIFYAFMNEVCHQFHGSMSVRKSVME